MPSNKDYKEQAEKLSEELGLEVETEGLNNEKLAALVSDLKAKKKDADNVTAADDAEKTEVVKPEVVIKPPYSVAMGKAITSKRGILSDGEKISASDLAGGEKALNDFVDSGHVVKS